MINYARIVHNSGLSKSSDPLFCSLTPSLHILITSLNRYLLPKYYSELCPPSSQHNLLLISKILHCVFPKALKTFGVALCVWRFYLYLNHLFVPQNTCSAFHRQQLLSEQLFCYPLAVDISIIKKSNRFVATFIAISSNAYSSEPNNIIHWLRNNL